MVQKDHQIEHITEVQIKHEKKQLKRVSMKEDLNILIKNRAIGMANALSKRVKFRDRKTSYAK